MGKHARLLGDMKDAKPSTVVPDTPPQSTALEPRPDFVPVVRDQPLPFHPSKVAAPAGLRPDLAALIRDLRDIDMLILYIDLSCP